MENRIKQLEEKVTELENDLTVCVKALELLRRFVSNGLFLSALETAFENYVKEEDPELYEIMY